MASMRLDLIKGVLILSGHDRVFYGKKKSQDRINRFLQLVKFAINDQYFLYRGHFFFFL